MTGVEKARSETSSLMEWKTTETRTFPHSNVIENGGSRHENGGLRHASTNSDNAVRDERRHSHSHHQKEGEKGFFKFFSTLSGRRKYTLILITLAMFLAGCAFSLIGPFYPQEAEKKGMSVTTTGIVFGVFEVVIFITAPLYGNYLTTLGPRFVFLSGIFIGGVCNILFGTLNMCPSGTPFIVMSLLCRCVEALGFSGFITSSFAIVSNDFKDNVGFTFGILETGSGLGFMIGPSLGGLLYEMGGYGLPFYVAGCLVIVNGMLAYKFLPDTEDSQTKRKGSMLSLLRSPMVVLPMFSVFIAVLGITTYDATFAKHVESLNLSVGVIGVLFGLVALLYSLLSLVWGYISDSKGIQSPLIVGGHLVFGVAFLMLGPSNLLPFLPFSVPIICVGLVLLGISFGCAVIPTMKCMVNGAVELGFEDNIDTYALVSGLFNSLHTIGGFIGPVGIGALVQSHGYPIAYTVVGMTSIFMMVVTLIFFTSRKLRSRRKALYEDLTLTKSDGETERTPHSHHEEELVTSGSLTAYTPFKRSISYTSDTEVRTQVKTM